MTHRRLAAITPACIAMAGARRAGLATSSNTPFYWDLALVVLACKFAEWDYYYCSYDNSMISLLESGQTQAYKKRKAGKIPLINNI